MAQQWNRIFTALVRNSHPRYWGNWSLDRSVQLGAIGRLATDGTFAAVDRVVGFTEKDVSGSERWKMSTSNVRRSQGAVAASGGVDGVPAGATGATLGGAASVKVEWSFSSSNELASEFDVSRSEHIENLAAVITQNQAKLNAAATSVGMRSAGSIDQGFGLVSGVIWAKSGANIAALTSGSTFGIVGKANALGAMLGTTSGNAGVEARYSSTTESGTFAAHLWPAEAEAAATEEVPVAFLFSSFEGDVHLPAWTGFVQGIVVRFRNTGVYIATVAVKYRDADGLTEEVYGGISGGTSRQIMLPLDATEVQFTVTAAASEDKMTWSVSSPFAQADNGHLRYQIGGVWPSGFTITPE